MSGLEKLKDEQIAVMVRTQDKDLYAEIIRRYEKKLLRYATYLINDEQLAMDAVQEGFIKAYVNLNSFNEKLKFSSWIYRIVHNQAISLVSKNRYHEAVIDNLDLDSNVNLEDELIKKELKNQLHQCINKMNIIYKEPLVLFFLDDKSYEEISDILRIPISTVGTRINRAKLIVKKICQKTKSII